VEYYVKCAPEFTEKSIDVLADMLMNTKFNTDDLEKEKGVIIQEMKMRDDDPMRLIYDKRNQWYI
jgi:predicted Zn-dependent peptidase